MATIQQVLDAYDLGPGDVILVDAGTYGAFAVAGDDGGVTILGPASGEATITGSAQVSASDVILDRLALRGGLSTTGDRFTLIASLVAGAGLSLTGGTDLQVLDSQVVEAGMAIQGVGRAAVLRSSIDGGVRVTGAGAADLLLANNIITGGLALMAPSGGVIRGNDVSGPTALDIEAPFGGVIENNALHGGSLGVRYAAPAALGGNTIFGNATGVQVTVDSLAGGFGFVGDVGPNEISGNTVGVELNGWMQNQHITGNNIGVTGSGVLGGLDIEHANRIEANAVGVRFDGTIQYTEIVGNTIGIDARSNQLIDHNVIARNTTVGVEVQGRSHVQLVQNTLYAPAGDNLRVESGSSDVEVRNNIFWAEQGYDLFIANDSQTGFFSDFNDLHSSGTGKLVYWTKDFNDILDWQADVARFDLHSIGRTVVNPLWSEPRFVNRAADDYRVFDIIAGQRFSSPTIDSGDPAIDLAVPASRVNLLVNSGFENGLIRLDGQPRCHDPEHRARSLRWQPVLRGRRPFRSARRARPSTCWPPATPRRSSIRPTWSSSSAAAPAQAPNNPATVAQSRWSSSAAPEPSWVGRKFRPRARPTGGSSWRSSRIAGRNALARLHVPGCPEIGIRQQQLLRSRLCECSVRIGRP